MFPRKTLDDLKGRELEVFIKDLPYPHCIQIGIIKMVTEHVVVLNDTEWKDRVITIPIANIIMVKEILE
ncbi:MAG: hypothetical protein ACFE9I_12260 [Candidatus Hermodarchaeota archaeon]